LLFVSRLPLRGLTDANNSFYHFFGLLLALLHAQSSVGKRVLMMSPRWSRQFARHHMCKLAGVVARDCVMVQFAAQLVDAH
jgi:hypothetical protein